MEPAGPTTGDQTRGRVTLEYEITEEDHAAFAAYALRHLPSGRRMRQNAWVFGVVAFFVYAATQWQHAEHGAHAPVMYGVHLGLAAALFGALFYCLVYLLPPQLLRTAARMGPRRKTLGATRMTLDAQGLELANAHGRGRMPWEGVRGIGESATHLYLWLGGFNAFIVPKHGLSADLLARARALASASAGSPTRF